MKVIRKIYYKGKELLRKIKIAILYKSRWNLNKVRRITTLNKDNINNISIDKKEKKIISKKDYIFRVPTLSPLSCANNPIITADMVNDAIKVTGVADPFLVKENGIYYCFFEICTGDILTSELGYAFSHDAINWKYGCRLKGMEGRCAFPNIFKYDNEWYMIPDTNSNIYVYRASEFPKKWIKVNSLINGNFSDTDIVEINDIWYLFTLNSESKDCISVYYNESGHWNNQQWKEHPHSTIIHKPNSRLGGGIIKNSDNSIILPVQGTISGQYGEKTEFYQISNITKDTLNISDGVIGLSGIHGDDWTSLGIHQIDMLPLDNGNLYVIDGLRESDEKYAIGIYTDGCKFTFISCSLDNQNIKKDKWTKAKLIKNYDSDYMYSEKHIKIKYGGFYLINAQFDVDKFRILVNNTVIFYSFNNSGSKVIKLNKGDSIEVELLSIKEKINNSYEVSFIEIRKLN